MASVMATGSEVFGSCVGEIDVAVGIENRDAWLCCGWKYLTFIVAGKVPQYLRRGWTNGARYWSVFLGALGLIKEIKSPCGYRGLAG